MKINYHKTFFYTYKNEQKLFHQKPVKNDIKSEKTKSPDFQSIIVVTDKTLP